MEEVSSLPSSASVVVEVSTTGEGREVVEEVRLECRVECECVECSGVVERDRGPGGAIAAAGGVGVESTFTRGNFQVFGSCRDSSQVGVEEEGCVSLGKAEGEGATLFKGVVEGVGVVFPE